MNWTSEAIRTRFIEFFKSKNHKEIPSAPMVIKNDPSLMFTNAGMNQFKDVFTGNTNPVAPRLVNSQKCLRVSGKHNDLEEVGVDNYHHTMFEMLGNWSFGDYFKTEAIDWAWEFLIEDLKISKDLLYVSIFSGDKSDNTNLDEEAKSIWQKHVDDKRILAFGKKDNFWEMGDTGPCGPCSEIHIDLRSEEDKEQVSGADLVNKDHPEVIEIWNLVFIQYDRNKAGELKQLPNKHVDTGMGLERLCRVMQKVDSNYDIDLFNGVIQEIESISGIKYGENEEKDIAFRVIADHIRPVCFAIAEGQLPTNTGPGYVIRRILRRAVRYGYSKLSMNESYMYKLVPKLVQVLGSAYEELVKNQELIERVLKEEEEAFLRTLSQGLKRINTVIKRDKSISGLEAFELYDTFGFPLDLTQLIAKEEGVSLDEKAFTEQLTLQKERSRASAKKDESDWVILQDDKGSEFIGYDELECDSRIVRYREVTEKKKKYFQLIFDKTCFYPEGGGQVGDSGRIIGGDKSIAIWDTKKENDSILHFCNELPPSLDSSFKIEVKASRRIDTARNHSATHLLHFTLREVLGTHVEQKGSLVHPDYLRFDFSHFEKISSDQLGRIEDRVNELIADGIGLNEQRSIGIEEAKSAGAMSLFGEKYGEKVRMISFGPSKELCGGIHVSNTREIGTFLIQSESSVAAGVRRIEAITGRAANAKIKDDLTELSTLKALFNNQKDLVSEVLALQESLKAQEKELVSLKAKQASIIETELEKDINTVNGVQQIISKLDIDPKEIKNIGFKLKNTPEPRYIVLVGVNGSKVSLNIFLSDSLVKAGKDAREIMKVLNTFIDGRGGGQNFFATSGGSNVNGIAPMLEKAAKLV